jgi:hypothetical protein
MRTEDPYEPGTAVKIAGQRGDYTYRYATVSSAGFVSLHVARHGVFRAVRPEQVTPAKRVRGRR